MRFIIAACAAVLLSSAAIAQSSGSSYDWRSGNSYSWTTDRSGTTHLNGNNFGTGSSWRTTIQPNGSQTGFDSQGNYWTYDSNTGFYQNFGTGRTCTGTGAFRTCY